MMHRFRCRSCGGEYNGTQKDGGSYHHACPPLPMKPKTPFEVIEREDKRDENLAHDRWGRLTGIVSEGKGVECLTSKRLTEQPWLTEVRRRAEKEQEELHG